MHRHEELGTRHELLIIDIAGVETGRTTSDAARRKGWRNPHASKKGTQRDLYTGRQHRDVSFEIERDDTRSLIGKPLGQCSPTGTKEIDGEILDDLDLEKADLEDVAGLRAFDRDRPDQQMWSFLTHLASMVSISGRM